jgi:hypothetical protein
MADNAGANAGADSFRPVNPPIPVDVRESAHQTPRAIKIKGHWVEVAAIVDVCSLDEEWWRERPIVRMYYPDVLQGDPGR